MPREGVNQCAAMGAMAGSATEGAAKLPLPLAPLSVAAAVPAEGQQVTVEVRRAVRLLKDSQASIEAAVASRVLAERNLEAEGVKFNSGLSTNFQVLEVQEQLATAQLRELTARLSYRKGLTAYYVALGKLLDHRGVQVADTTREAFGSLPWW